MEQIDSNAPVLEATAVDVSSAWRRRVEITGVDWKVLPGEYWVIGGPHGSGKTDLLMVAAGLYPPAAGSVKIFGRDRTQASEAELVQQRTRIGFVFKGGGRVFNELTVAENVALALNYHRKWSVEQTREEVGAVLEITELTPLAQKNALRLGSEWQQRVGLARALALKPEILFLDEPAAGMAARHYQWWRNFLAQLPGRKVTVITTTNDFAYWHGEGHRYALIKDHRLQVLGRQAEYPRIE